MMENGAVHRREIQAHIYGFPGPLSRNILDLPIEITVQVFTLVLPAYPTPLPPVNVHILAQVCRQWRNIVLFTPRLWRALQLDIDAGLLTKQLDLLRNWLRRSGTLPLSIRMAYRATGELDASIESLKEFVQEIMLYSRRWHHMELELPFDVLPLIQGEMSCLSVLTIQRSP
ncbi:hypothetical protein B0H13DRAFT_38504 [Mycena leptocephala]|nr:hypothetical protein B0H13DRAFT_38504 [Mycena leptocephala]